MHHARYSLQVLAALLILSVSLPYEYTCPHASQRKFRARAVCNSTFETQYSCLYDTNYNTYSEICTEPDFVPRGYKYVITGALNNKKCSNNTYQPIKFWSNKDTTCILNKSYCHDFGQIKVIEGDTSAIEDSMCRCDYTKGFAFVTRPTSFCYCIPSHEDCSCYIKHCPHNYILTPDYKCVHRDTDMDERCSLIFSLNTTEQETIFGTRNTTEYGNINYITAAAVVLISLLAFVLTVGTAVTVCIAVITFNYVRHQSESYANTESMNEENSDNQYTSLMKVCRNGGNVKLINFLIASGCAIDKPDDRGKTPLMVACAEGHFKVVQHLIKNGAKYNADDVKGNSVFFWSCVGGNVPIINFLIAKIGDTCINVTNTNGETPLMAACAKGNLSAVKSLIKKGAHYNVSDSAGQTVFYWSCIGGNVKIIKYLKKKGCDNVKPNKNEKTPLMAACGNGQLSAVEYLINIGGDFNASDSAGQTVFYWSCIGGNVKIIKYLKDIGCNNVKPNKNEKTPLMAACGNGQQSAVKYLIDIGGDFNASDSAGQTVFYWSCIGGNVEIIKYLKDKGCGNVKPNKNGKTPLMAACGNGQLFAVKYLLELGADNNASDVSDNSGKAPLIAACGNGHLLAKKEYVCNAKDSEDRTAMFWSVVGENIHIIEVLIDECNIDAANKYGETPLMVACGNRHLSAVELLINKGADFNASDKRGQTVLYWSCVGGNVDIIKRLIGKGCDMSKPNNYGKTPLMAACGNGHLSAVEYLIKIGAECNACDSSNSSVFFWSCVGGKVDIIDILIKKGCELNKSDRNGKSPLMEACSQGHLSAVERLIQQGASVNASDSEGRTVFYWSCIGGNDQLVENLIIKGCDINQSDKSGKTPLMVANDAHHLSVVKLLNEKGALGHNLTDQNKFYYPPVGDDNHNISTL